RARGSGSASRPRPPVDPAPEQPHHKHANIDAIAQLCAMAVRSCVRRAEISFHLKQRVGIIFAAQQF
ncbi:MAG: hypothetical protein WD928_10570, partial [Gammaproteobacteria bacterium]